MKTFKKNFKRKNYTYPVILISLIMVFLVSCNSSPKEKEQDTANVSEELQDVKEEIKDVVIAQKKQLKSEVDSVITAFENQITRMEIKMDEGEKKLNSYSKDMLKELKAERDTLKMKMSEIEDQTNESWEAFKKEIEHDTEQFAGSVEDFFHDNV